MATLFKRAGSPFFWARFSVPGPDGRAEIVRRSTKRRSRKEAAQVAQELESAEQDMAEDLLQAKLSAILKEVAATAARGALSEARAREYVRRIHEAANEEELIMWTLNAWLEKWLERKAKRTSPATMARYRNSVKAFRAVMGDKLDSALESINREDLRRFQDALDDGRRTARTVNHYVADVAGAFRSAVREGVLVSSPAAGLDRLDEDEVQGRKPFEQEELEAIYEACPSAEWKGVFLLGTFAGLRLGDATRLRAGSVDLFKGSIEYKPTKTKRTVTVPMHPELLRFFQGHDMPDEADAVVFPSLCTGTPGGRSGLSGAFSAIIDKAGVDRCLIAEKGADAARTRYAKGFHSLRHTFVSGLANAGVSRERRKLLAGHREKGDVHGVYTHLQFEQLKNDIEKLAAVSA